MSTKATDSKILLKISEHWLNNETPLLFKKISDDKFIWTLVSKIPKEWEVIRDLYKGRVKIFNENSSRHRTVLDAESADPLWVDGYTLYLIDYFEMDESGVQEWLLRLKDVHGYQTAIVSIFVSFPGAAMPYHWDAVANLTCQVSGAKRWWTHHNSVVKYPDFNFAPSVDQMDARFSEWAFLDLTNDEVDFTLDEGTGVFLSRGLLHRTTTQTPSISVSVTFKPEYSYIKVLNELAYELSKHEEYRIDADAIRHHPNSSNSEIRRAILKELAGKVDL